MIGATSAAPPIPAEAKKAISAVHTAADTRDFSALRALMIDEFVWSFGGDSDAQQAIGSWRTDPSAIDALSRVTSGGCGRISKQYIQCPKDAGMSYRAGFTDSADGWRMTYFVAGD